MVRARCRPFRPAVGLAFAVWIAAVADGSAAPSRSSYAYPDSALAFGPDETARCLDCHGIPMFLLFDSTRVAWRDLSVDGAAWGASAHSELACTRCHDDVTAYPHVFTPRRVEISCDDDCHAVGTDGRAIRHVAARAALARSVHATAFAAHEPGGPGCVTCHGGGDIHAIGRRPAKRPARHRLLDCVPCHEDGAAMRAAGVDPDAVASYRGSFHFKALRLGSDRAPGCDDCHGAHEVRAALDTASTVHARHVSATCGREGCHPGAAPPFSTSGANHLERRVDSDAVLSLVRAVFRGAGTLVFAALAIGVVLEWRRRALRPIPRPRPDDDELLPRLSAVQRLQHGALVLAFTTLTLTGLPMQFADFSGAGALHAALGGPLLGRALHRGAAVVLIVVLLVHAGYALALRVRRRPPAAPAWTMLPTRADLREFGETVAWTLGRRDEPPAHGRHHFRSKLHYVAAGWGVLLMTLSGLVLWFPVFFSAILPDPAVGLAQILHGDEALLAVGVVLVWHVWLVHVRPGRHHRFLTWLDGRITRGQWRDEHALEPEPRPASSAGAGLARDGFDRAQPALLAGVLALAALLRAREAVRTPLWFDELFTLWMARHPVLETLRLLPGDIHPPLPTMLVSLWWAVAGDHTLWLRTLPIAIGLATIVCTWGLSRALFGTRAALLAATLLALHPSHIYYSQELRGYGLLALAVTLAAWGAWEWRRTGAVHHAAMWIAGVAMALHTHYLSAIPILLLDLAVLPGIARSRRWRGWLGVHAAMALLAAPLLMFLPVQLALSRDNWIVHPSWAALADLGRRISFEAWYALPAFGGLAGLAARRAAWRGAVRFALWLAAAPIVVSFALTHVGPHLFAERYMYFTLPCWCALFAAGLLSAPWKAARPALVACALVFAARAALLRGPHSEAVALRDVATWLAPRLQPGDALLCADAHSLVTLDHHLRKPRGVLLLPEPRLPYYLGAALIAPARRVPLDSARTLATGGRWWGVYVRESGRPTAKAAALLDSLAEGEARTFGHVMVWSGGGSHPTTGLQRTSASLRDLTSGPLDSRTK